MRQEYNGEIIEWERGFFLNKDTEERTVSYAAEGEDANEKKYEGIWEEQCDEITIRDISCTEK